MCQLPGVPTRTGQSAGPRVLVCQDDRGQILSRVSSLRTRIWPQGPRASAKTSRVTTGPASLLTFPSPDGTSGFVDKNRARRSQRLGHRARCEGPGSEAGSQARSHGCDQTLRVSWIPPLHPIQKQSTLIAKHEGFPTTFRSCTRPI
jgi:hypothetical protein